MRAAQRRASCSQLKRALVVLAHAWSAVAQHVRQEGVRRRVLQQRRLPPALRRVAVPPLAVQPLPLLKQTLRLILARPQKMAPRRNAPREMERLPHAALALQLQQPRRKHTEQRRSAQHSPPLLQPYVDASEMPVRRVRWRSSATAEHGAPTFDVGSGGQAVHGMRRELRKERVPRSSRRRVR